MCFKNDCGCSEGASLREELRKSVLDFQSIVESDGVGDGNGQLTTINREPKAEPLPSPATGHCIEPASAPGKPGRQPEPPGIPAGGGEVAPRRRP